MKECGASFAQQDNLCGDAAELFGVWEMAKGCPQALVPEIFVS